MPGESPLGQRIAHCWAQKKGQKVEHSAQMGCKWSMPKGARVEHSAQMGCKWGMPNGAVDCPQLGPEVRTAHCRALADGQKVEQSAQMGCKCNKATGAEDCPMLDPDGGTPSRTRWCRTSRPRWAAGEAPEGWGAVLGWAAENCPDGLVSSTWMDC